MANARQMDDTPVDQSKPPQAARVRELVRQYWGFDSLRPLQGEAIAAALAGRDSLVVLPTGGGKSLCFQVPPLVTGGTDVIVSPLIALMKDQVDSLEGIGYPAAALHGNLSGEQRGEIERGLAEGRFRLLMAAPERLVQPGFLERLRRMQVRRFIIDEAHCISHWGHDFRPEYRQLAVLREQFPKASLHAFTATATEQVRSDIVAQLGLRDPQILVGCFDRPNLVYRVVPQVDRYQQSLEVLKRHEGEAAIVYCLSRRETEEMAGYLRESGLKAAHYHAGMEAGDRRHTQDEFSQERLDIVVATVAFGMGIDRSNVRCVLHAGLPKSVEHYQQETGRAGRDGLEAECVLLYTAADAMRWESLIRKSAENAAEPADVVAVRLEHLRQMQQFASVPQCRHKLLSEYFGQTYERDNCGACEVCLGEVEGLADSTVVAQKILSCVARVQQRFGVGHVVDVLLGANTEMIRRCQHDQLSTYGLLKEHTKKEVQSWAYQLIDQGLLSRTEGDRPIVQLNEQSWRVLRGEQTAHLRQAKKESPKRTKYDEQTWEGADRGLFERLRQWRRGVADQRGVAPFLVLHDNNLKALATLRPTSVDTLLDVPGMGQQRVASFGKQLVEVIVAYCRESGLESDVRPGAPARREKRMSDGKQTAMKLFAQGKSRDEVAAALGRAASTVAAYLAEYIATARPKSIRPWVDNVTYARVAAAAAASEDGRLKPIFEALGGEVPYETIRIVVSHLQVMADGT